LSEPGEITPLLERAHAGDRGALDQIARRVQADLSRLARKLTAREGRGRAPLTLDTSDLVNETFVKLLQQRTRWKNRAHFFAIATRAMVRMLLDHHRASRRNKRGGGVALRVSLSALGVKEAIPPSLAIPDLHAIFASLEDADERAGRVARLRILWGLDNDEIAEVLGVSRSTVDRDWRFAAAWIKARV
jgi:RNA polymerase sigma factor (TIGR02999 family)